VLSHVPEPDAIGSAGGDNGERANWGSDAHPDSVGWLRGVSERLSQRGQRTDREWLIGEPISTH